MHTYPHCTPLKVYTCPHITDCVHIPTLHISLHYWRCAHTHNILKVYTSHIAKDVHIPTLLEVHIYPHYQRCTHNYTAKGVHVITCIAEGVHIPTLLKVTLLKVYVYTPSAVWEMYTFSNVVVCTLLKMYTQLHSILKMYIQPHYWWCTHPTLLKVYTQS